jgi:hypothetical protein
LQFAPKTKDESNKLRRKNSLNEAIIEYLTAVDAGPVEVAEYVDTYVLKALSAKDRKEDKEDPRIAGMNKAADEVRSGNMRTLRSIVVQHFKTINRRYQGKHNLNNVLHIAAREGYMGMVETVFDDSTRIPEDREVKAIAGLSACVSWAWVRLVGAGEHPTPPTAAVVASISWSHLPVPQRSRGPFLPPPL